MTRTRTITATLTAVAALGAGGTALAATSGDPAPTTITVVPAQTLQAGDTAPFDAPGAKAIRHGKAIPSGYVLVGYRVTTHKGAKYAGAALRFACPAGKRLRTFGITGNAGFNAPRSYAGAKATYVMSTPDSRLTDTDGRVYAICR
jgi:hypothetical protein